MRSLYLRIWLTVVAALALFAVVAGLLVRVHLHEEERRFDELSRERMHGWAELVEHALPPPQAAPALQAQALGELGRRLRAQLALDDAQGRQVAATEGFQRRQRAAPGLARRHAMPLRLEDGRTLWVLRPGALGGRRPPPPPTRFWQSLPGGVALAVLLALLFAAVALGAWPVVRRLTRRLEALKLGVQAFGQGALHQRVDEGGRDEVAALAASFNQAAGRIETLVRSHQSLLANASHELRSPLARLKMALTMLEDASPEQRARLRAELDTNIAELDALVEEVLLASRLDAQAGAWQPEPVALLPLLVEEGARVQAEVRGEDLQVPGEERLLRRALRNLLENARRYGAGSLVEAEIRRDERAVIVRVCDRGPGIPEASRERVFEPFFRLPGHAERAGGVGLGLALVRQIAQRHGGTVRCLARDGGGSCFELELPLGAAPAGAR